LNVFPFQIDNPAGPLRTKQSYFEDITKANLPSDPKRELSHGIKGRTLLNELKHYHPILSTTIDYMHSFLEGYLTQFLIFCL
jgi:hypothetical protein